MDCSAAIGRAQRWKDTNVAYEYKTLALQHNDDWKEIFSIVQLFQSF